MSYHGGIAAKKSDGYERQWTVKCVLQILRGEADRIHLEPISEDASGFEFILDRASGREYHQVKRRLTGTGHWTLGALANRGVLKAFATKLAAGHQARFVSAQDADDLHELAERACNAEDLQDFYKHLQGKTWTASFQTLVSLMGLDEQSTFEALRRTHVTVLGEAELIAFNEALAEPLIDAPPADSLASLQDLIGAVIPGTLDAPAVWEVLKDRYQKHPRRWSTDTPLREAVAAITDTYLTSLQGLRLTHPIKRDQVAETIELLKREDLDGVMVTAGAGAGKSDILFEVVRGALSMSWPTLCLRADQLAPTHSPLDLGAQLALPGSPVGVLAALAKDGPSLLVIDQLDAVSLASGRLTDLWDVLYTLITHARATPGMRVMLAARQFDVENDHRLRSLTGEQHKLVVAQIPTLEPAQVTQAVNEMGLDAAALSERQRALLTVPLHLVLLETIAPADEALSFTTLSELFELFWRRKQKDADSHAGRQVAWAAVIEAVADYMSEHRRLDVPVTHLEEAGLNADAEVLVSESVLVAERHSYRFFHETFFDFAFARFYLAAGNTIGELLGDDDQDLFRRAQVRQLLTQQRDSDHLVYLQALSELLVRGGVRFHIKQLLSAWLASLTDPGEDELDVLTELLDEDEATDDVKGLIWRALSGSGWFGLVAAHGFLDRSLDSTDVRVVNAALEVLRNAVKEHPREVALLLSEHDDASTLWRDRIAFVIRFSDVHASRELFDLLLNILDRDSDAQGADHEAWLYGHDLPEERPEWAAELLAKLLTRAHRHATTDGHPHALTNSNPLRHEHSGIEFLQLLGQHDPGALLGATLPFIFATIDADLAAVAPRRHDNDDQRLPVDSIWSFRLDNEIHTFDQALLRDSAGALAPLAAADPPRFETWADALAQRRDETSQFLLYEGLMGDPARYADYAAERLLEGTWRYWATERGEPFWVVHQLLEGTAPHLAHSRIAQLETAILGFATSYERQAGGQRTRGYAEFQLLSGLAAGSISADAQKVLAERQRKFREEKPAPPQGIIAGYVRSPISRESARHMSDEDWLSAIAKHRERWENKRSMDLVGGASELAGVFQAVAQDEPERFAELGLRLPAETLPVYVEMLLAGLARPSEKAIRATPRAVVGLIRHAQTLGVPASRPVPELVARYAEEPLPQDILLLVAGIAIADPDPTDDVWKIDAGGGTAFYGGSIEGAGVNSARGGAAEALAVLIYAREDRADLLLPAVTSLASDPITSVRACAAQAIHGLMRWRREQALQLLLTLADTPDEALLATNSVTRLIADALTTDWPVLRPLIERMLDSPEEAVKDAGGTLASIAALDQPDTEPLLQTLLSHPDASVRRGTAKVLAGRVISAHYRARCTDGLTRLFDDEDEQVRVEAAKAFWRIEGRELQEIETLAHAFLASRAFAPGNTHFLYALERSTADISDLALATAERVLGGGTDEQSAQWLRPGAESRTLSTLLLRVLGTLDSDRTRVNRALDMLDKMLAAGGWGVGEAIETIER